MFFTFIHLVHFMVPNYSPMTKLDIASDLRDVVLEEPVLVHKPGNTLDEDRKLSGCIAGYWFGRESNYRPEVTGDGGSSHGVGQIKSEHVALVNVSLADVKTNRRESMRAAYRLMRHEIVRCGGVVSGLGAYASGKCGKATGLVASRIAIATDLCTR